MKSISIWLGSLIALLCITSAQAAGMEQVNVVRDYTDKVAPADQQAYEAGVKSYNQCLSQHGFNFKWTAWVHETGDTYSYSYTSDPVAWASFDSMQATGKACYPIWQSAVNPHLKSETSAFFAMMPELTHMPKGMGLDTGLIDVTYFKLKYGHEAHEQFENAVKMITAAAAKSNWPGNYMTAEVQDGDQGAPDFILVWPSKNWADFGMDINPPFWKMVENVYGKKKAGALRKSLNNAVQDSSSHVDSYSADLTYTPTSK